VTFSTPAALWGLLAIPLFVVLYLLRVRRRQYPVSSVLLWERSAPTLAAYRPTHRIERSLLLLLQIMATGALVIALAGPSVIERGLAPGDLMLVLDVSLSMQARDVPPTRFDRARAEALDIVSRLRPGQRAGIVIAAPRAEILVPLTTDRARLGGALRAASPWDAAGDVAGAVVLAEGQLLGEDGRAIVWTDAARAEPPALPRVRYRVLGTSDDNVGITAFRAARDPGGAEAFLRVDNFSAHARRVPVEVTHTHRTVYRATLELPAGGHRSLAVPIPGTGVFEARLGIHDQLPDDDVATAVLDPSPLPSVLLVSAGNPYLERLLRVLPLRGAAEAQTVDPKSWASYGVVILDRVNPGPLPPGDYLLIASIPPNLPVSVTGSVMRPQIAAWQEEDRVLQFVDLSDVHIARALGLATQGGRSLAGGDAPLLWAYEGGGIRALLFGFALQDSDLPQRVAFPILIANSLAWLGGGALDVEAGEALQVPAGGSAAATMTDPAGRRTSIGATMGMLPLPPLTRAGVYRLESGGQIRQITVRGADPQAGLIRPGAAPQQGSPAGTVGMRGERTLPARVPVYSWFILGAIAAVTGEWILATRRRGGDA
jgi:hypothetical protein